MGIWHLPQDITNAPRGNVLVIGNFDAVHRGHVALIDRARKIAEGKGAGLSILTLEPHPRRLFRPDDAPFRITSQALKLERLKNLHPDGILVLAFDWGVASISAQDFIKSFIAPLKPAAIVVGEDFHFGHNRSGNIVTLQAAGYEVLPVTLEKDGSHSVISATRIRGLIQSGQICEANELLGWDWYLEGIVQKGDQRGRELGYPTANVPLGETIHPAYGVYAAWVRVEGEENWRMSATNIGIRPMFEIATALVEAHILDFSGDIYGKRLDIRPVLKIRNEEKFSSLDDLIVQIEKDCREAKKILSL